jgi:hypothetical protein
MGMSGNIILGQSTGSFYVFLIAILPVKKSTDKSVEDNNQASRQLPDLPFFHRRPSTNKRLGCFPAGLAEGTGTCRGSARKESGNGPSFVGTSESLRPVDSRGVVLGGTEVVSLQAGGI